MIDHFEYVYPRYQLTEEDERLVTQLSEESGWSRDALTAMRRGLGDRPDAERAMREFAAKTPPPPEPEGWDSWRA